MQKSSWSTLTTIVSRGSLLFCTIAIVAIQFEHLPWIAPFEKRLTSNPTPLLAPEPIDRLSGPRTAPPTRIPPQSTQELAFLLAQNSSADLYRLDMNGHALRRLAQNIQATTPAWSPDHQRFAIAQSTSAGDIQIAIMDVNGSRRYPIYTIPHRLISDLSQSPIRSIVWSADGKQLAFDVMLANPAERSYIYIIDTLGHLIQMVGPSDLAMYVSGWLPNNRELAYVLHDGTCNAMYVYYLDDSANRFLVGCNIDDPGSAPLATRTFCSTNSGNLFDTAWSANAQYLAVILDTTSPCEPDIIVIEPDTSRTFTFPYNALELAWAPENNTIAYTEAAASGRLCLVDISGASNRCSTTVHTTEQDDISDMTWLPDKTIAFVGVSIDSRTGYYSSQICRIIVDTFAKNCLTGVLPGMASIVGWW